MGTNPFWLGFGKGKLRRAEFGRTRGPLEKIDEGKVGTCHGRGLDMGAFDFSGKEVVSRLDRESVVDASDQRATGSHLVESYF